MDTSGFYKNDKGEVLHGNDYVVNLDIFLVRDLKDQYTYPVDGWYWFDSAEEAYSFYGIEYTPNENNGDQ